MGKRGYERIDRIWDENALLEVKDESLAATALEKHDAIIRRNLGMNENQGDSGTLNLHVLAGGGRSIISVPHAPHAAGIADIG
jgi:hypothetical protein